MSSIEVASAPKKVRVDGNMTGLSGELFVAGELLKRNLQVSITFGSTKHIDLFAHNSITKENFTVQVKALRSKGYFPIQKIFAEHIYVFVVLNEPGKPVQYSIVPGQRLLDEPSRFPYQDPKFPGLYWRDLAEFEGAWNAFGC